MSPQHQFIKKHRSWVILTLVSMAVLSVWAGHQLSRTPPAEIKTANGTPETMNG